MPGYAAKITLMSDIEVMLSRLGLAQYTERFLAEGFDSWDTIVDITESDLNVLNVKLGHRRKLQRAIAESRRERGESQLGVTPGGVPIIDGIHTLDDAPQEGKAQKRGNVKPSVGISDGTKRKYRRHPKPDEFAPERPASAYVIFSNQMREELRGQDLSFTELAKVIGEKWQLLPPDAREECEQKAAAVKEKYNGELAEYKKTEEYATYQAYLAEFKAKQATQQTDGKRAKLEQESSYSARESSRVEQSLSRQPSRDSPVSGPIDAYSPTATSPTNSITYSHKGYHLPPHVTSPTTDSFSRPDSPKAGRSHYSPMALLASATSAISYDPIYPPRSRDNSYGSTTTVVHPLHSSPYDRINQAMLQSDSSLSPRTMPPALTSDIFSRRTPATSSTPMPLVHEDTSGSSESANSGNSGPLTSLLDPDVPRTQRLLPKPVNSAAAAFAFPSFDQRAPIARPPSPDSRSLAALLRAGDLAREADAQSGSSRRSGTPQTPQFGGPTPQFGAPPPHFGQPP